MPTLKSGAIIVGAYANKVRKTLFAQLKNDIKAGTLTSQEVARAAGELNQLIFKLVVEKMKLDKGDVVRITCDYIVENGKIKWQWSTLKVEAYRKVPEDEINYYLKDLLPKS